MGLAGLALESYEVWPTYPERMADADVTAGLVLPNAAVAMMGQGGAVATLFLAYMAIMSTYSSELIAISSISSYDIYKTYINPNADGKQLMRVNYISMIAFALFMGGFSTMLYYVGVSMGFLYLLMGVCISAAVIPAALTLTWSGQSWAAATFTPPLGFCCSITSWLVTTNALYGEFTVETTGSNTPMLVGNVVALLSPLIFVPILTYLPPFFKPQNYDWVSMANIRRGDDHAMADAAHIDLERVPGEGDGNGVPLSASASVAARQEERAKLDKASKIARILCVSMTIAFLILWPMPLFGTGYVFSREFFTGWVVVGIIWLFCSVAMVVFLPIFQSRFTIVRTTKAMFTDFLGVTGRRAPEVTQGRHQAGDATPPEAAEEKTDEKP